jgi:hypothetical protein
VDIGSPSDGAAANKRRLLKPQKVLRTAVGSSFADSKPGDQAGVQ